ncbi:U32 family peptidase (plasmid) [Paracoccus versutus]|uniref:Ubiquinone biosynthesis protein UbiV n=1 Tax=Paracoccus versutus TaxID=34007 RepID=A0AAQ0HF80_PARVE|nr:U32 family peptidase [Paracoccus versutus]KGJ09867.1 protease [Paracoccus versutus]REG38482.1 collagenase-like PrtC family protease [Paracoccus versutus]WEJ82487.1 U32 family peptidase [Paracoccus versutus]
MDLTVGPIAFFWSAEQVRAFYRTLADTPVQRVVIGEWVCSKRLPFWQHEIPAAVEVLQAAGKEVALSTLTLITLKRERRQTAELFASGLPVEIADLTALQHLPEGAPFWVGPTVNVYNEGTLEWLAAKGAQRICLPPELPLESVAQLARAGQDAGVAVEVWGHGRAPLAISGRCYHARLHDRAKDSCQFVCAEDPDGRTVETLEGQPFLTVNGVQTLSYTHMSVAGQADALRDAGVAALRLSPQPGDFAAVTRLYAQLLESGLSAQDALAGLRRIQPGAIFAQGFLEARPGAAPCP